MIMSRAFVRNDAPAVEVVVPPRPPLPAGTANYVTPRGMALLRAELARLETRRAHLQAQTDANVPSAEDELAVISGSLAELQLRIASARVIDPPPRPHDVVRFGATVSLKTMTGDATGEERTFTIVGVDEAAAQDGRVAFTAPLARAVLGLRVGETGVVETPYGREILEVTSIR
jgi:transcription elongation factor GreB